MIELKFSSNHDPVFTQELKLLFSRLKASILDGELIVQLIIASQYDDPYQYKAELEKIYKVVEYNPEYKMFTCFGEVPNTIVTLIGR